MIYYSQNSWNESWDHCFEISMISKVLEYHVDTDRKS